MLLLLLLLLLLLMLLLVKLNLGRLVLHDLCRNGQGSTDEAALPVDVLDAHLFLEVLLEAGLVGELPEAVGALERHALATPGAPTAPSGTSSVCGLQVVVEEALLGKVLPAVRADKGPLPGVHPVVDVEVALARVRLGAHRAHERLLASVRAQVLLQRVVVVARLGAEKWEILHAAFRKL